MRIAVVIKDRCQPKRCAYECIKFCPPIRNGVEVIVKGEKGKVVVSEELCVGCGICTHKCPFEALKIIQLPEALGEDLVHQYGENGFRLFRLPVPIKDQVVGILGPNGIGKSTIFSILSNTLVPNMGLWEQEADWSRIVDKYSGTEVHNFLEDISKDKIKVALKPQYVDKIPSEFSGVVKDLLDKVGDPKRLKDVIESLDLGKIMDRELANLSGGELQRVAVAATVLKDADVYLFDEPSSYLDIYQRLKIARAIHKKAMERYVMIVEHDLAILDFLADIVYLMYGSEGAYGIVAQPRGVRAAINTHLQGFMREENIRFRETEIEFQPKPPREEWDRPVFVTIPNMEKWYEGFTLIVEGGEIHHGEVVGVLGPNATGKTTLVKLLAGLEMPNVGNVDFRLKIAYKPQYIQPDEEGTVEEVILSTIGAMINDIFYKSEIERPLRIKEIFHKDVNGLSGGELQRLSIALCLAKEADMYLIDEPSAYLDANQRMEAAKTIRRVMEKRGRPALIVDHDVYFIDLVSDSLMVFSGEASVRGVAKGPFGLREGMNAFLKDLAITFRRDGETNRPRINKQDSRLDREQKASGEYYYSK
jgi:ATP-binding cassette subfamily E protein 1